MSPAYSQQANGGRGVYHEAEDGSAKLITTMTPAGQLTSPHIDGTAMGSCVLALFGVKVLFTWAPTDHNLRWMESRHQVICSSSQIAKGISELEEMSVSVLFPGQGVWMDPGTVHAVMAVTCSCVTGWEFVDMKWIEDDDCVRRIMGWELELLRRRKKNPDGPYRKSGRHGAGYRGSDPGVAGWGRSVHWRIRGC